jgi:hypothetical protein
VIDDGRKAIAGHSIAGAASFIGGTFAQGSARPGSFSS